MALNEQNEKIILSVELDYSSYTDQVTQLKIKTDSLKSSNKELAKEAAAALKANDKEKYEALTRKIVENETSIRTLTKEQKNLKNQSDLVTAANKAAAGSYEQLLRNTRLLEIELKQMEGTLEKNSRGQLILTDAYKRQSLQVEQSRLGLIGFNKGIASGDENIGRYPSTLDRVKAGFAMVAAAATALYGVINFGKQAWHSFVEAEKNAKQLGLALKNAGGEGSFALNKLLKQSEELQKKGIFSDDAIQQAQTQLANYGMSSEMIEKLIPQISDLAAATGKDLKEATDIAIKGINGQTKGLKLLGIDYKDTGDKTKNLALLTEQLTKFQGANAAQMDTVAGRTERLKNVWDDFMESVGEYLVGVGSELLDSFDVLSGKITVAELSMRRLTATYGGAQTKVVNDFIAQMQEANLTVADQKKEIDSLIEKTHGLITARKNAFAAGEITDAQFVGSVEGMKVAISTLEEYKKSLDMPPIELGGGDVEEKEIKTKKEHIENLLALQVRLMKDGREKALRESELQYQEEIKQEGLSANAKLLIVEFYNQQRIEINEDFDAAEKLATQKLADDKIRIEKETAQKLFDERQKSLNDEIAGLKAKIIVEEESATKSVTTEQKLLDDKLALIEKERLAKVEAAGDAQGQIALINAEAMKQSEALLKVEDDNRQARNKMLIDESARVAQSTLQYFRDSEKQKTDYEISALEARLQAGNISQTSFDSQRRKILTKQAKDDKAFAIASAALNGAVAVTKALASLPPPANFAAAIAVGIENGLQIALIAANKIPTFKHGGVGKSGTFGGNLHSNGGTRGVFEDGTQIEVERDEHFIILNRRASAAIGSLSRFNAFHGGDDFAKGESGMMMAGGGMINVGIPNLTAETDQNIFSMRNQALIMQATTPAPIVIVQDIVSGVEQEANRISRATIG